jgi:mannose-1-phosphate guanylyltransferase
MIPIGRRQKPLLEYIIRLLHRHGVKDITLLVGYKHEQIENYFDDGSRFGVKISYVRDSPDFAGTGGALLNAYLQGMLSQNTILIYYGDILSNIDLTDMLRQHGETRATATLAVSAKYQLPVGVVEVQGTRIVGVREKPQLDMLVGIGILALEERALEELRHLGEKTRRLDIMSHLLPHLVMKGEPVHAYITDAFWCDVGSIESYEKLRGEAIEKYFEGMLPQ